MDLGSVRAAPTPVLIRGITAAAKNAQGLLYDARVLAEAGCAARACSLAALAVEEAGKAASLSVLTMMPEALRVQAPIGRMLEWHQLKQVQGLFIAAVPYRSPGMTLRLATMPAAELRQVLSTLDAPADEADCLKRRGLYVDVGRGARVREPSEITESEVLSQLDRAGRAASAAGHLFWPETQAWLVNPPTEGVELSRAAVSALTEARYARTPGAATNVMFSTISKLRDRMAAEDARSTPARGELGETPGQASWPRSPGRSGKRIAGRARMRPGPGWSSWSCSSAHRYVAAPMAIAPTWPKKAPKCSLWRCLFQPGTGSPASRRVGDISIDAHRGVVLSL